MILIKYFIDLFFNDRVYAKPQEILNNTLNIIHLIKFTSKYGLRKSVFSINASTYEEPVFDSNHFL